MAYDPTTYEIKREAFRHASKTARVEVFLEVIIGLSPTQVSRVQLGVVSTTLRKLAAERCTIEEARATLRESARKGHA